MVQLTQVLPIPDGPGANQRMAPERGDEKMMAVKGLSMEKWLCWGSMGAAGLLCLMFLLDITVKIPFQQVNVFVDVFGIIASGLVFYLAWDAFKDIR